MMMMLFDSERFVGDFFLQVLFNMIEIEIQNIIAYPVEMIVS